MKRKILIFSALLLFLSSFAFVSCKKLKENRLEGTWKFISYSSANLDKDKTWTFSKNGDFVQTVVDNSTTTTTVQSGTYAIRVNGFKTFLDIFDIDLYTDGKYKVVKLSGKVLKTIQISDGDGVTQYILKDFTKE